MYTLQFASYISFIFGMIVCYFSDLIFKLTLKKLYKKILTPSSHANNLNDNKTMPKNILKALYLAELVKLTFFSLSVLFIFKNLKLLLIDPKIFIITISIYLIFNFAKNLLKLIL